MEPKELIKLLKLARFFVHSDLVKQKLANAIIQLGGKV